MAGRRLCYLAVLLGCLAFYIFYREWLAWLVLLLVLLTPIFSLLVSLPAMWMVRVGIRAPKKMRQQEPAEASITIRCRLPKPLFRGKLLIQRPMTGEQWKSTGPISLPVEHCGGLKLRIVSGYVYDYLGLFRHRIRRQKVRSLVVRPQEREMEAPSDLSRYLARNQRLRPGGSFAEHYELRQYQPGDNLRHIHWKLTAKTGEPMVRDSMQTEEDSAVLTMDLSGTPEELDRKLGQLLWMGRYLLNSGVAYELWVHTGNGVVHSHIDDEATLNRIVDRLLWEPAAKSGSILDQKIPAAWTCHVGGPTDET